MHNLSRQQPCWKIDFKNFSRINVIFLILSQINSIVEQKATYLLTRFSISMSHHPWNELISYIFIRYSVLVSIGKTRRRVASRRVASNCRRSRGCTVRRNAKKRLNDIFIHPLSLRRALYPPSHRKLLADRGGKNLLL